MRLFRNPELKGILALAGIALVLAVVFLALTGKLTEWTGWQLTLRKPLTDSIVFVSDRNGHPDIWVMRPDGADQKPLTNDDYADFDPVVSPDGYTIAFVSKRGTQHSQIYAMDSDGTHVHRLTEVSGAKSAPRFTPDGKSILFLCAGEVWEVGLKGERPERVLPTEHQAGIGRSVEGEFTYRWAEESPEGSLLAAVQSLEDHEIAIWMKPGDEAPVPIVHVAGQGRVVLGGEMVCAAWQPGSEKLALTLTDSEGSGVMAIADMETESVRPVLMGALGSPSWSPDGSAVVAEHLKRNGPGDYSSIGLVLADLSAETARPIVRGAAKCPIWSPDGKRILYTLGRDICSFDIESKKITNLTKGRGSNYSPAPSPVGK